MQSYSEYIFHFIYFGVWFITFIFNYEYSFFKKRKECMREQWCHTATQVSPSMRVRDSEPMNSGAQPELRNTVKGRLK